MALAEQVGRIVSRKQLENRWVLSLDLKVERESRSLTQQVAVSSKSEVWQCWTIVWRMMLVEMARNVFVVFKELTNRWHCPVVRTSVFGWRTFADLRLICGWHVITSWVTSQPSIISDFSLNIFLMNVNVVDLNRRKFDTTFLQVYLYVYYSIFFSDGNAYKTFQFLQSQKISRTAAVRILRWQWRGLSAALWTPTP